MGYNRKGRTNFKFVRPVFFLTGASHAPRTFCAQRGAIWQIALQFLIWMYKIVAQVDSSDEKNTLDRELRYATRNQPDLAARAGL